MEKRKLSRKATNPSDRPAQVVVSETTRHEVNKLCLETRTTQHYAVEWLLDYGCDEFLQQHGQQLVLPHEPNALSGQEKQMNAAI